MGVETWNRGNVNVWEPTTNRKVHLEGTGPHTVRSSNKAVTYLTIWDGAGDDDISVGSLNTHILANAGNDRYHIESGINAIIENGAGYKTVSSDYIAGTLTIQEKNWWSSRYIDVRAGTVYMQTGYGNDTIKVFGLWNATVNDAGGNNNIDARGAGVKVTTGSGNDVIFVSGVSAQVWCGDGADTVTLEGLDTRLWAANTWGNKQVTAYAGGAYIYTGHGNDRISFYGLGARVESGAGDDTVSIHGIGAYVNLGAGNNRVDSHGLLEFFGSLGLCLSLEALESGALPSAFDSVNQGFLIGQGAALVVLDSSNAMQQHGRAAQARLLAAVTGGEACNSVVAQDTEGLGFEHVMRWALQAGQCSVGDIDLVKTHGTGTSLNNQSERSALLRVLGPDFIATAYKPRIGHTFGASGLIESVLAINDARLGFARGIANRSEVDQRFLSADLTIKLGKILALAAGMGNVYGAALWEVAHE